MKRKNSLLFRILSGLLLITVLLPLFSGCGEENAPVNTEPTKPIQTEDENDSPVVFSGGNIPEPLQGSGTSMQNLGSEYAIVINADTMQVLASKNADKRFYPASITKVMTMIVLCERLTQNDLTKKIEMTSEVHDFVRSGGYYGASCFGFDVGDVVPAEALLYDIGVKSDADATMMMVRYLAGSEAQFVGWMNEKAQELGMTGTHFDNAIGYESDNNYSTAKDLSVMMAYALRCDLIRKVLSTSSTYHFQYEGYNKKGEWVTGVNGYINSTLFNTASDTTSRIASYEKLHGKFSLSKGIFEGGKTGSLKNAKNRWVYSLASFGSANGQTYVVITGENTDSSGVMEDTKTLFDFGMGK